MSVWGVCKGVVLPVPNSNQLSNITVLVTVPPVDAFILSAHHGSTPMRYVCNPDSLPSAGFPCLYLFGDNRHCKVGKTINLARRAYAYGKGQRTANPLHCLAYVGPLVDLASAERQLVAHFAARLYRFNGKEWFTGDTVETSAAFASFVTELHKHAFAL